MTAAAPRPVVVVFVDWFLPAYRAGGPIRSVANIVHHLGAEAELRVVTSDRDLGATDPHPGMERGWSPRYGAEVLYCPPGSPTNLELDRILDRARGGAAYLNSLFSRRFTLSPLRAARRAGATDRVVVAPRGMLGAGALAIKRVRKRLFLKFCRATALFEGVMWHGTTEEERDEILFHFGADCDVVVAPNLIHLERIDAASKPQKNPGTIRLCFLSRVSPIKNLDVALEAIGQLSTATSIRFDLYGPIEDRSYFAKCMQIAARLPPNVVVEHRGSLEPSAVVQALTGYHFLLLPTTHENFGHAILEAMAAGCPAIIGDQTPWRDLRSRKLGWDTPPRVSTVAAALAEAVAMGDVEYREWVDRTLEFVGNLAGDSGALDSYRKMFRLPVSPTTPANSTGGQAVR